MYFESQMLAFFYNSPQCKCSNFLWGYWFLAKNIDNLASSPWKLIDSYYNDHGASMVVTTCKWFCYQ